MQCYHVLPQLVRILRAQVTCLVVAGCALGLELLGLVIWAVAQPCAALLPLCPALTTLTVVDVLPQVVKDLMGKGYVPCWCAIAPCSLLLTSNYDWRV